MILCAAIKYKDTIIPCHRHYDAYEILYDFNIKADHNAIEEGFIATNGTFLNRKEAFVDAINCGQLSEVTRQYKREKNESILYSEDLY